MVKTPWYNEEIPFTEAAEIGTEKVIKDHSTIGIVVTSDGSIGEFQRNDYLEAENRVVEECTVTHKHLKTIPKNSKLIKAFKYFIKVLY